MAKREVAVERRGSSRGASNRVQGCGVDVARDVSLLHPKHGAILGLNALRRLARREASEDVGPLDVDVAGGGRPAAG